MFVYRPYIEDVINEVFKEPQILNVNNFPSTFFIDKKSGNAVAKILIPGFSKENVSAVYENGQIVIRGSEGTENDIWGSKFVKKFHVDSEKFDVSSSSFVVENGILSFSIKRNDKSHKSLSFEVK